MGKKHAPLRIQRRQWYKYRNSQVAMINGENIDEVLSLFEELLFELDLQRNFIFSDHAGIFNSSRNIPCKINVGIHEMST
jgi:hypothetical protein